MGESFRYLGNSTARGYEAAVYEDQDFTMHFFPLDDLLERFGPETNAEDETVIAFVKEGLGLA